MAGNAKDQKVSFDDSDQNDSDSAVIDGDHHAPQGARPLNIDPIPRAISLASQAYEHIKAAIVAGDVLPGQLYSITQFASLLGVSRTPVREALLTLVQEGMLTVHRNRGFQVVPGTKIDIEEIIDLRELLEIPAMERLARLEPRPTETFAQARRVYTDLQLAADESNLLEFLALDRSFHVTLVEALGNNRLTRLIGELRDHSHLPGLRRLAANRQLHDTGLEHLWLLEAVESGDSAAAGNIMRAHLARTRAEWS